MKYFKYYAGNIKLIVLKISNMKLRYAASGILNSHLTSRNLKEYHFYNIIQKQIFSAMW
jgi:hypothetical protein